jgi:4-hydroxy-3-methylbut-2-en-1-yl diphosphate synthase IspG/GcpE
VLHGDSRSTFEQMTNQIASNEEPFAIGMPWGSLREEVLTHT